MQFAWDSRPVFRRGNSVKFHADKAVNISLCLERDARRSEQRARGVPCLVLDSMATPMGNICHGGVIDRTVLCFPLFRETAFRCVSSHGPEYLAQDNLTT